MHRNGDHSLHGCQRRSGMCFLYRVPQDGSGRLVRDQRRSRKPRIGIRLLAVLEHVTARLTRALRVCPDTAEPRLSPSYKAQGCWNENSQTLWSDRIASGG
jgi:hypothetical protein